MKKKLISPKCCFSGCKIMVMVLVTLMLIPLMVVPGCSSSGIEEGDMAPDFTLEDLHGNQVSLSDLRGNVVFLNFWAFTCGYCKDEMPDMETLYQEYMDRNAVVISVTLPGYEDEVPQFVADNAYSWTFLLDKTGAVGNKYEIKSIPASFFLDTEGIIRVIKVGKMSYETMETNLTKTINKE